MNFIRLSTAVIMSLGGMAFAIPTYNYLEARQVSLQVWEGTYGGDSLKHIMQPALDLVGPIVGYVLEHPWVLLALVIPALEAWLTLIGFHATGVVAGSIAASLQSAIGNVPKGSLFALLQSNGAGGFAYTAMRMAGIWVAVAVALAALGKVLLDGGAQDGKVEGLLEQVWAKVI